MNSLFSLLLSLPMLSAATAGAASYLDASGEIRVPGSPLPHCCFTSATVINMSTVLTVQILLDGTSTSDLEMWLPGIDSITSSGGIAGIGEGSPASIAGMNLGLRRGANVLTGDSIDPFASASAAIGSDTVDVTNGWKALSFLSVAGEAGGAEVDSRIETLVESPLQIRRRGYEPRGSDRSNRRRGDS